jgi:hypothetical protein
MFDGWNVPSSGRFFAHLKKVKLSSSVKCCVSLCGFIFIKFFVEYLKNVNEKAIQLLPSLFFAIEIYPLSESARERR